MRGACSIPTWIAFAIAIAAAGGIRADDEARVKLEAVIDEYEASWRSLLPFICEGRRTEGRAHWATEFVWGADPDGLEIFRYRTMFWLGSNQQTRFKQLLFDPARDQFWKFEARPVDGVFRPVSPSRASLSSTSRVTYSNAAPTAVLNKIGQGQDLRTVVQKMRTVETIAAEAIGGSECIGFKLSGGWEAPGLTFCRIYFDTQHGSLLRRIEYDANFSSGEAHRHDPSTNRVGLRREEIDRFGTTGDGRSYPVAMSEQHQRPGSSEFERGAAWEFSFRVGEKIPERWVSGIFPENTIVRVIPPKGKASAEPRLEVIGKHGEVVATILPEEGRQLEDLGLDRAMLLPKPVFDLDLIPLPAPQPLPPLEAASIANDAIRPSSVEDRGKRSWIGVRTFLSAAFAALMVTLSIVALLRLWRRERAHGGSAP